MKLLHNIYSKKQLKIDMLHDSRSRYTLSFYKYCDINDPITLRNKMYIIFLKLEIFGRIYISKEGVNAQISVLKENINQFKICLSNLDNIFYNIHINQSLDIRKSFWMLQIKIRKKIISDGLKDKNIDFNNVGNYLKISDVNNILKKKDTICVDMRNEYEYVIGHFINAIKIPGETFRSQLRIIVDFLKKYKKRNIVMYCTGGIRCEKATAWLKHNGFNKVYQIHGGILNYLYESRKNNFEIKFQGKMFVFDNRIAERISNDILSICYNCGIPCDDYINCKNDFCHKLFIQCTLCSKKYSYFCSSQCKKNYFSKK
ncbi:rhodanese-related sulfurtransferase [Buchnera aphidicola]|uniref:oxygen-dependent tRNA uridine(34) hydroxylase TrhO n=1 Tax=Buchnera aphidicola TaxID=9 RepID=UPI0031B7F2FD